MAVDEYTTGDAALEADEVEESDELGDGAGTKGIKGVKVDPAD